MKNQLRYSLIYAVVRPEISERISVGMIILDEDGLDIRCSSGKLKALEYLVSRNKHQFVVDTLKSLKEKKLISSESEIEYLSRYSNNMINISGVQTMNLTPTAEHKDWLFKKYVSA